MSLNVTILGCGASGGVPLIGCSCRVCTSTDPRNRRLRASIHLEHEGYSLLIDTSPDLREQCLTNRIMRVDAVFYTHAHADHIHGIDDMRSFNYLQNGTIPVYGDAITLDHLQTMFSYIFTPLTSKPGVWMRPSLTAHAITPLHPVTLGGLRIVPFEQTHGKGLSLGIRIGNFAYCTDVNHLSDEALVLLEGVDTLVIDCLQYDVSPTHACLPMTLDWIARIRPKRAYLTHMSHVLDYSTLEAMLPKQVFPAYDGLRLTVE